MKLLALPLLAAVALIAHLGAIQFKFELLSDRFHLTVDNGGVNMTRSESPAKPAEN